MTSRPLVRDAAWSLVAIVLIGSVRAGARIGAGAIGLDELRAVTIALSVAGIVTIVTAGGWSPGITKFVSELRGAEATDDAERLATLSAWLVVSLSAVGGVVAFWYTQTSADLPGPTATLTGILTVVLGLYLAGKAIAYGRQGVKQYALLEIVGVVFFAVAMTVVIVGDRSDWVVVPLVVAFSPVAFIAVKRLVRRPSSRGLPLRSFSGYGLVGVIGSLAGLGFTSITPLAADRVNPVVGAALIGAALTYLEPLTLAPRAIGLVLLPELSRGVGRGEDRAGAARSIVAATAISALLAGPIVAILLIERDHALQWLFPDDLVGGATLAWFAAAFWVSVIGAPAIAALAAIRLKEASVAMWSSLVGFGIAIVLWLLLGDQMGVVAIGFGYFVGSCIQVLAPLLVATRSYSIAWGTLWLRLGGSAAGVLIIAATGSGVLRDFAAVIAVAAFLAPEIRSAASLLRSTSSPKQRRGSSGQ